MSSPSTFKTPSETCLIQSWKETRDGPCKVFFHVPPTSGQVTVTVLSLHINNIYVKKKSIAKKLILAFRAIIISQQINLVAGHFTGTAWRCHSRNNISTTDEALLSPPGPTPLWGPGSIPKTGPSSDRYWKVRMHGALSISRRTFGFRPTDQSCHHETWLHLDFVDWRNTWEPQCEHSRHISLKERPASFHHGQQKRRISDVMSDRSFSS